MAKDNGGPAFPRPMSVGPGGLWQLANEGMFLRDNFAGLAMQGFISDPQMSVGDTGSGGTGWAHSARNDGANGIRASRRHDCRTQPHGGIR